MKSALTNTITETILYDNVDGEVSKPLIQTQYLTNGTFVDFNTDLESRILEISNENDAVEVYNFMPPVKKFNMTINNFEQKYSPDNTASPFSGILKKNLEVRAWSGYELTYGIGTTTDIDDFSTNVKFVHTQELNGSICPDVTSFSGTMSPFAELGVLYDGSSYSSTTYAYPGYYHKRMNSAYFHPELNTFKLITSSNKMKVKYRTSKHPDLYGAAFNEYTTLATGTNTFNLSSPIGHRYLDYIVRFENPNWATSICFNTASLESTNRAEMFKQGTFLIDDPKFNGAKVNVSGRDAIRRALETEINLPVINNLNSNTVLTKIFDRCNISYDTSTWYEVATTISYTQDNSISGWKACDYVMDAINAGDDDIRLNINENGKPEVKKIPTDIEADFSLHYKFNQENLSKSSDTKKQIQRITVMPNNYQVSPELTMGNFTGTTSGNVHIVYPTIAHYSSGEYTSATVGAGSTKAIYVRYIDNNNNILLETDRSQTSIDFTVSGTAYDITILGSAVQTESNTGYQERGNSNNIINGNGSTYKRVNPFINDNTTRKALADYCINLMGDPKKKITATMRANPLCELNDNLMVFSKYDYTDDIYGLVSIMERWSNPGLEHTFELKERGFNLGSFIYDRNGKYQGVNDTKWDTNFIWDQDLGPNATADTTNYRKKVGFL